jgi:hypothetical protein
MSGKYKRIKINPPLSLKRGLGEFGRFHYVSGRFHYVSGRFHYVSGRFPTLA